MFDFDSWGDKVAYIGAAVLMVMFYNHGGWGFLKHPYWLAGFIFIVFGALGYIFQYFFPDGISPYSEVEKKTEATKDSSSSDYVKIDSEKQKNITISKLSPEIKGVLLVFIPVILVFIFMTLNFPS